MTTTEIPADSLAELSYGQLVAALKASNDEYETRYAAFIAATETIAAILNLGLTGLAEAQADMTGKWAACKAQREMGRAIAEQITKLRVRDYYA